MTPAFLVDIQKVRRNCERMREKARASGVVFRPHVKTHKTVEGAILQHGGTKGPITVSTLAEGEFFAAAGFEDITYAVPIDPAKLARAAHLAQSIRLNLVADHPDTVAKMARFPGASVKPWNLFLKIDCGYGRAGVDPRSAVAMELIRQSSASEGITLRGLLTHAGHSYQARSRSEILAIARQESEAVSLLSAAFQDLQLIRSVGSTPTASIVESFSDVDEVRPGNYLFYDAFQASIGSCSIDECAVSVLTTVISLDREKGKLVIDAGALALSKDLGATAPGEDVAYGFVCDESLQQLKLRLISLSQEHGVIRGDPGELKIGSRLRIIPNHSCLTAAMFERYHIVENGAVTAEWRPVRGW